MFTTAAKTPEWLARMPSVRRGDQLPVHHGVSKFPFFHQHCWVWCTMAWHNVLQPGWPASLFLSSLGLYTFMWRIRFTWFVFNSVAQSSPWNGGNSMKGNVNKAKIFDLFFFFLWSSHTSFILISSNQTGQQDSGAITCHGEVWGQRPRFPWIIFLMAWYTPSPCSLSAWKANSIS